MTDLFPQMSESQYNALRDDIAANGQREPITLWHGQVIDGAHRAKACDELGRAPLTRDWEGEEAGLVAYVVSLNLHRRHLSESQRAMVAEKLARTAAEFSAGKRGKPRTSRIQDVKMPIKEAAELLNVGHDSVSKARIVRQSGVPELTAAVEAGDITVYRAAGIATLSPEEQRVAMANPKTRNPNLFKHPTKGPGERVERAIESIGNMVEMLCEAMSHVNGDKRRAEWAKRLRPIRTEISRFITECER